MTTLEEANDPNTPPERLAELLMKYPREVFNNPALPLILLEDPEWLERNERYIHREVLLTVSTLPRFVVEHWCQHKNDQFQVCARAHVALGEAQPGWEREVAQELAAFSHTAEDLELLWQEEMMPAWLPAFLPPLPPVAPPEPAPLEVPMTEEEQRQIAQLPIEERVELARTTNRPEVLRLLFDDAEKKVRFRVLNNHQTPPDVLACFPLESPWDSGLVGNPSTPADVLDRILDRCAVGYVGHSIVVHPQLTQAQERRLAEEFGLLVPNLVTPEEFVQHFGERQTHWKWALGRSSLPRWARALALHQKGRHEDRQLLFFCGALANNRKKDLTRQLRASLWFLHFATAIHPLCRENVLRTLARSANRFVRAAARARLADPRWRFQPERAGQ